MSVRWGRGRGWGITPSAGRAEELPLPCAAAWRLEKVGVAVRYFLSAVHPGFLCFSQRRHSDGGGRPVGVNITRPSPRPGHPLLCILCPRCVSRCRLHTSLCLGHHGALGPRGLAQRPPTTHTHRPAHRRCSDVTGIGIPLTFSAVTRQKVPYFATWTQKQFSATYQTFVKSLVRFRKAL